MKTLALTLPVLVLLAGSGFCESAASRMHLVRYGDTLWELSIQYYGNPFYWEQILGANPSLRGPEYLRPGEHLMIPDIFGHAVSGTYDPLLSEIRITSVASSRPLISRLALETAGMVTYDLPDPAAYVVELRADERTKYGEFEGYPSDIIALDAGTSRGVETGGVYSVLKVGEEVTHPSSGEFLGYAVRVAGVCRVIESDPASSLALIEHGYLPVSLGDLVVPYTPMEPVAVSTALASEEMDAYVVAFRDPDLRRAYAFDVIYIDRGSAHGIRAGDVFSMLKYGTEAESPTGGTVRTPDVSIGHLIVLNTRESTSAAMIYSIANADLIEIGDRIELFRRQL